jgi:hypothetical protein
MSGVFLFYKVFINMKKVIKLTESDLTRIVKRVIKENEDNNVKKLVSLLVNNGLVDEENINVYDDHIEVYGILITLKKTLSNYILKILKRVLLMLKVRTTVNQLMRKNLMRL